MKTLVLANPARVEKYRPNLPILDDMELAFASAFDSTEEILEAGADADFIFADAVANVTAELIGGMPNLKLIHPEGVAYNGIDVAADKERGVYVCNCRGVNAGAVAEQAILLMLALLRSLIAGDAAVRAAHQIQMKERLMMEGITELGDCTVGIIGLGAVGKELAKRLAPFGCEVIYFNDFRHDEETERACNTTFVERDELLSRSDIVSLHVPALPETINSVDAEFLAKMKPGALLINTARGEIVDQPALAAALVSGHIGGAGLDTLAPEPVQPDNPLINLPEEAAALVVFSPHAAGITEGMFYRAHRIVWENIARVAAEEEPINKVMA